MYNFFSDKIITWAAKVRQCTSDQGSVFQRSVGSSQWENCQAFAGEPASQLSSVHHWVESRTAAEASEDFLTEDGLFRLSWRLLVDPWTLGSYLVSGFWERHHFLQDPICAVWNWNTFSGGSTATAVSRIWDPEIEFLFFFKLRKFNDCFLNSSKKLILF